MKKTTMGIVWMTAAAALLIGMGCSKKSKPKETILAVVGDKTITADEFIKRAELTIRPLYPAADAEEDKGIVLNNLVYEKVFAIEADDQNLLANNENFKSYIQGIKEQNMRKRLFEEVAANTVKIDSNEINTRFQLSKREYRLSFFSIHNDQIAAQIAQRIKQDPAQRDSIFNEMQARMGKTFEKDIKWNDPEADMVHEALFSKPLVKNQILGPVRTDEGYYLIMKVADWKELPIIGSEANQIHRQEVLDKMHALKAKKIWNEYKYNLMKGKEIKFTENTLKRIIELFNGQFAAIDKIKQNPDPDNRDLIDISKNFSDTMESMIDLPFFTVDGENWTVGDFKDAMAAHPLVYPDNRLDQRTFPRQFRTALVDLVCDTYLTKEAEKKSLDKDPIVVREASLWKDANLSLYYYKDYLKTHAKFDSTVTDTTKAMNAIADALLDSLKQRYARRIQIDAEALKTIELNRVPFSAYEMNVPYPQAVPTFPNITSKSKIEFEKKGSH